VFVSAADQGANCVVMGCCTESILVVVVLPYREKIGGGCAAAQGENCLWGAALQGPNLFFVCCCIRSKLFVGLQLYREQIVCLTAAVHGGNGV